MVGGGVTYEEEIAARSAAMVTGFSHFMEQSEDEPPNGTSQPPCLVEGQIEGRKGHQGSTDHTT